jgi:hypothetical protein
MRRALIDVVGKTYPEKPVWRHCQAMSWLTPEQQLLCAEFTRSALLPISRLNGGERPTELKHVNEPIVVPSPSGEPRRVAAETECGAHGPIVFHYDTVRTYSPKQLFQVLAHEFGHKVAFQNAPCVGDNEPIGAFSAPGGGRKLMDAFAMALTQEALERGIIGDDFGLLDYFRCTSINNNTGDSARATVVSQRMVFDKGVFDRFETGVGIVPRDSICELSNSRFEPEARYLVRMRISENAGCRLTDDAKGRRTEIGVIKVYEPDQNGHTRPTEEIVNQVFEGVNPICENEPRDFETHFSTGYGNFSFQVRYLTTQALGNRSFAKELERSAQFVAE